jgi:hypothetical protein
MKNGLKSGVFCGRMFISFCCLGSFVLFALGCGGEKSPPPPPSFPVTGKVFVDDQPLTQGVVSVYSQDLDPPVSGSGLIGNDGTYELSNGNVKGVPLGKYKVTVGIRKTKKNDLFPPLYSTVDESPLSIEVKETPDAGAYNLNLSKSGTRK